MVLISENFKYPMIRSCPQIMYSTIFVFHLNLEPILLPFFDQTHNGALIKYTKLIS